MYRIVAFLVISILASSCISTTPGDAAFRSCHIKEAARLYEWHAVKNKNLLAVVKLARFYDFGISVSGCYTAQDRDMVDFEQNKQKAIYWYKKALEYGDPIANWNIGIIYKVGDGNVKQDFIKAEEWFLKGARLKHHNSMYYLAGMYANNEVSVSNDIEGLRWLNIVQDMANSFDNNELALFVLKDKDNIRQKLESRMNSSQINKAKSLSENFLKDHKAKIN